nr:pentatricopeptide repeat-containing protein At5g04780-like [Tanacetum cinerariifolium]
MIGGLAQHGHGKETPSLFDEMLEGGVAPDNKGALYELQAQLADQLLKREILHQENLFRFKLMMSCVK